MAKKYNLKHMNEEWYIIRGDIQVISNYKNVLIAVIAWKGLAIYYL